MRKRTVARLIAVQMLYAIEITNESVQSIEHAFKEAYSNNSLEGESFVKSCDEETFSFSSRLLELALKNKEHDLDLLSKYINSARSLERSDIIDLSILRLGVSELFLGETPFYAVIDDYVSLSAAFSDKKTASFVNGVLQRIKTDFHIEATSPKKAVRTV